MNQTALFNITFEFVTAYVARNQVQTSELPALIRSVHAALGVLGKPSQHAAQATRPAPPVPIKKSVTNEYIISLEDGKRYKTLKRHLTKHGLTPEEYRAKWDLPIDYPMVARSYAAKRSASAKAQGLGDYRRKK